MLISSMHGHLSKVYFVVLMATSKYEKRPIFRTLYFIFITTSQDSVETPAIIKRVGDY